MYELLYSSIATKRMDASELKELLSIARKNNKKNNITGMLIYSDREFVQLLEGEKESVLNIYNKIKQDTRHSGVKVFHEGGINSRSFQDWSMACKNISVQDELKISGLEKWKSGETPLNVVLQSSNIGKDLFLLLKGDLE